MIGTCECCDRPDVPISHIDTVFGIEAYACYLCRGEADPDPYAEAKSGSAPVKSWNAQSAIEQIQKCRFECEGGPLENNDAWRWIVMTLERREK